MNKSINQLVQEAHQNAVSKGWWEEERSLGEIISLIHSEASEALEDYRAGRKPNQVWYELKGAIGAQTANEQITPEWKPCGIPSELADIVIRVFDACGRYGLGEALANWYGEANPAPEHTVHPDKPFAENLSIIHGNITDCYRSDSWRGFKFAVVVQNVMSLAEMYSIDLEKAINEKMTYNATRPQKHGGKVI